jgi:hypothetical protein
LKYLLDAPSPLYGGGGGSSAFSVSKLFEMEKAFDPVWICYSWRPSTPASNAPETLDFREHWLFPNLVLTPKGVDIIKKKET